MWTTGCGWPGIRPLYGGDGALAIGVPGIDGRAVSPPIPRGCGLLGAGELWNESVMWAG